MSAELKLSEVAALLAVAQDHAFGQPAGAQLRATVLAQRLASVAAVDLSVREATWWTSTLRFLGCTGHSYDMAVVFGDEIEMRAKSLRVDGSNPLEMLRLMISHAGPGRSGIRRLQAIAAVVAGGKREAAMNFRTACEVGEALAARLGLDPLVRASLAANFERWNGRGLPTGTRGENIPLPMRFAQLAQELEVLSRINGIDDAVATIRRRRGKAYDPDLADLAVEHAPRWWAEIEPIDPWDAALIVAPNDRPLDAASIHATLLVVADFADLKSPWLAGHSRAVADLMSAVTGRDIEAAALLHDLGRVGVANPIWDKPAPLTRDERDRAETHSLITEQLLRRTPYTAAFAETAGAAHERQNASGYHRHAGAAQLDEHQRLLATADIYQAMISLRPHRPAFTIDAAAGELRTMVTEGRLDAETVERILAAAGHPRQARPQGPGGITGRETEVLRLVALGLTVRQIADRLVITPKTADHHIQNIYSKIGVSTRGAAALYAIEHGVLHP